MDIKFIEFYGIIFSYIFLIMIFMLIKQIKIDSVSIILIFFCLYILMSCIWGSSLRDITRIILPFSVFFIVWFSAFNIEQIIKILIALLIGFIIPIIGSSAYIFFGYSGDKVIYHTGLVRFSGLFNGSHSIAHSMFISIFFISLLENVQKEKYRIANYQYNVFALLTLAAFYNIYKSGTRTVLVALIIYSMLYLYGNKKYAILLLVTIVMGVIIVTSAKFQIMFYDVINPIEGKGDFSQVGSGRIGGWGIMLKEFFEQSIPDQIIGSGSNVKSGLTRSRGFGGGHNDFLDLIFCFGYIGLMIYLMFLATIFNKIVRSKLDKKQKYIFIGFLLSIIAMNVLSNSYLARFELAQYFSLSLGLIYCINDEKKLPVTQI